MYSTKDLHAAAEKAQDAINHLVDVLEHFDDVLLDKKVLIREMEGAKAPLGFILVISAEDDDD